MTTIIQKMWRDGVPGPDGGLVQIAERPEFVLCSPAPELPVFKCAGCDRLSYTGSCGHCYRLLSEDEQL